MNFFQKLFSQPKVEPAQPIAEFVADAEFEDNNTEPEPTARLDHLPPGLHIGKLTDVGRERDRNEDSMFTIESFLQHNYGQEPFGLFIVADGMGGHQKGEVASALAARITADNLLKEVYLPYLTNNHSNNNRPLNEVLVTAVQTANTRVQEDVPDGGTTLTAVLLMGNTAYIAHVGDTRTYLFKEGELKQVTKDHSLARRLQETGQATAEEVMHVQNVLYKAIGQGSTLEVDTYIQHVSPGASLLLCSDGLWGSVGESSMSAILNEDIGLQDKADRLLQAALEAGGTDNITFILVSFMF